MQHILVSAQDPRLAKKVRILLARDECDVEILDKPHRLEQRLKRGGVSLLVLSRELNGDDAIDMLARFDPSLLIPKTMILGGPQQITADFIHLVPDPIDTRAIYRIASEILSGSGGEEFFSSEAEEELTIIANKSEDKTRPTPAPDFSKAGGQPPPDITQPVGAFEALENNTDEAFQLTDVTGLDEIADQLDQLESDHLNDQLSDAFDIDESSGLIGALPGGETSEASDSEPGEAFTEFAAEIKASPSSEQKQALGGLLEPARFAKALYLRWSKQESGALIVARDQETLTIHFEEGLLIRVESSIPGDQLGKELVGRGRLTEAQYAEGAKRAIERGLRLDQALVDLGYFTEEEIGREIGQSAREQLVQCFASRQGAFEFDPKRKCPTNERPYRLALGGIITEGIKLHADQGVLDQILTAIEDKYFRVRRSYEELQQAYPLTEQEFQFLDFGGRAYNIQDAAENVGMSMSNAHKLMALLTTCEEVEDFTPSIKEFEDRIKEERTRNKEIQAQLTEPPRGAKPPPLPDGGPGGPAAFTSDGASSAGGSGMAEIPSAIPSDTPMPASPPPPPPSLSSQPAVNGDADIPPMPGSPSGDGAIPRPLVYAKPLPRGPDNTPLETPERSLSREHFQRGVTLLGQGNFSGAEEAFRDAVALCAEEHVYLIGLARAIYYNPEYKADGKVPVLKAIVGRAEQLAPEDNRVATLKSWVDHAEARA